MMNGLLCTHFHAMFGTQPPFALGEWSIGMLDVTYTFYVNTSSVTLVRRTRSRRNAEAEGEALQL